jgi:hypothetical protein
VWQEGTREVDEPDVAMSGREEALRAVAALWWEQAQNISTSSYGTSQPQYHAAFSILNVLLDTSHRIRDFEFHHDMLARSIVGLRDVARTDFQTGLWVSIKYVLIGLSNAVRWISTHNNFFAFVMTGTRTTCVTIVY